MSFRFKRKESVAKAARRLCRERLEAALEYLKDGGRMQAVHNVRREIKKLRAILRLVRGVIERKIYRKHTKALRAASNLLTATRDAHVRLSVFEKLIHHAGSEFSTRHFPKTRKALQEDCREEDRRFCDDRAVAAVKRILRELKRRIGGLEIESDGWAAIGPGLQKSYGRGREAFETVREEPLPENFHEWRKRVKDLWHHVRLIGPAWPKGLHAMAGGLSALATLLGDDHDLELLKEFVADGRFKRSETETLNRLIVLRQMELRSAAVQSGARLYLEEPDRFCRRLEGHWERWRKES